MRANSAARRDPDEHRYGLKRFLLCQALGLVAGVARSGGRYGRAAARAVRGGAREDERWRDLASQRYQEKKAAAGETVDAEARDKDVSYELNPQARRTNLCANSR